MDPAHSRRITIELDLLPAREYASRQDGIHQFRERATHLGSELRRTQDYVGKELSPDFDVRYTHDSRFPSKSDTSLIEAFLVTVTVVPVSLWPLAKLVINIVNICKTTIATEYEVEIPGKARIRLSGPNVGIDEVRKLSEFFEELAAQNPVARQLPEHTRVRIVPVIVHGE